MARRLQNEYRPESVSPPGETLQEALLEREMTQAELAERTGRPRKTISEIITGKSAITPETALQLERVLGIPASFWNKRERLYREYLARKAEREQHREAVDWLKQLPVAFMTKEGWVPKVTDRADKVRTLLNFFGVASVDQWRQLWTAPNASFRRSLTKNANVGAVAAWLRRGQLEALQTECEPYSAKAFRQALLSCRDLTMVPPERFCPALQSHCAAAGVAVVFVKEPPGSRVSGATRWLSPQKALIQLSIRYRTNDHLWFTFYHEAGHILLHGKRMTFLESKGQTSHYEEEANRFSADFLIPPARYRGLIGRSDHGRKTSIKEFAHLIRVAPGIVVGRLQHDGYLPHNHCNDLKMKLKWTKPRAKSATD